MTTALIVVVTWVLGVAIILIVPKVAQLVDRRSRKTR